MVCYHYNLIGIWIIDKSFRLNSNSEVHAYTIEDGFNYVVLVSFK